MIKTLTCIECPKGCRLTVETDAQGHVIKVAGNQCEKGAAYGRNEAEHPVRILTSTVLTQGLPLKMLSVRTSAPIPRERIPEAMAAIKKIRVTQPVKIGQSVCDHFLGLDVQLVATRDLEK